MMECKFEKGQVWQSADNTIFMITEVSELTVGNIVRYVDEYGMDGKFYDFDRVITDSITPYYQNTKTSQVTSYEARDILNEISHIPDTEWFSHGDGWDVKHISVYMVRQLLKERAGIV